MSSKYICRSCLHTLRTSQRHPSRSLSESISKSLSKSLSTSHPRLQEPAQTPASPPTEATEAIETKNLQKALLTNLSSARPSARERIAQRIGQSMPEMAGTYQAYGATEQAFLRINELVGYDIPQTRTKEPIPTLENGEQIGVVTGQGDWYSLLDLKPTFNNWAQLTMLHLYVLMTRIRALPSGPSKNFSQSLTDHFFMDAETKMDLLHQMNSRSIRSKYLKDLFLQWRGALVSYDEGLVKGDAVLAAAVWRNVLQGRGEVDFVRLGMVVGWMRREVKRCGEEEDFRRWQDFGGLKEEESTVLMKSHLMDKPFA